MDAVAEELDRSLGLGHVELGLVATVSSVVGALATVPVGMLTDRVSPRAPAVGQRPAEVAGHARHRGGGIAERAARVPGRTRGGHRHRGPTLASLVGDLFFPPPSARVWGLILTGELVGAGIGLVGSGEIAALLSWRIGFWWLAIPGVALALAIRRMLREPARADKRERDAQRGRGGARRERDGDSARGRGEDDSARGERPPRLARDLARRRHVEPHEDLVLRRRDPVVDLVGGRLRPAHSHERRAHRCLRPVLLLLRRVQVFAVVLMRSCYDLSLGGERAPGPRRPWRHLRRGRGREDRRPAPRAQSAERAHRGRGRRQRGRRGGAASRPDHHEPRRLAAALRRRGGRPNRRQRAARRRANWTSCRRASEGVPRRCERCCRWPRWPPRRCSSATCRFASEAPRTPRRLRPAARRGEAASPRPS